MIIFIDIDETICTVPARYKGSTDAYKYVIPIWKNIAKANKLFDQGHYIVYWTSRGQVTNMEWTEQQLAKWGVLYNELRLNKPQYDLWIDDKALNANDWE